MSDLHPLLSQLIGHGNGATAAPAKAAGALAYVRVSTDMQEDKGLSIPAQRKAIESYAAAHDVQVLETYVEAASSYQDESKRVEFRRMFERAKADPQVSMVLVHESSRFSRHPWRTPQLIGELQDAGVRVVSATEPEFDVSTVMGMWMQKVMEAKNASYSMEVAFHTRKGMRQNANARDPESGKCYKNGGRPPWRYRTVRKERKLTYSTNNRHLLLLARVSGRISSSNPDAARAEERRHEAEGGGRGQRGRPRSEAGASG